VVLGDLDKSVRVTGHHGQLLKIVRVIDVAGALEVRVGLKPDEGLVLLVLLYRLEVELSLEFSPGGEQERNSLQGPSLMRAWSCSFSSTNRRWNLTLNSAQAGNRNGTADESHSTHRAAVSFDMKDMVNRMSFPCETCLSTMKASRTCRK
jgi:hypothetical protein